MPRVTLPRATVTKVFGGDRAEVALVRHTSEDIAWVDVRTLAVVADHVPTNHVGGIDDVYDMHATGDDVELDVPDLPLYAPARRVADVYAALRATDGNREAAGARIGRTRQAVRTTMVFAGWLERRFPGVPGNPLQRRREP